MLFLTTEDVGVNVARVIARGLMQGHSSPAEEIRSIFDASMSNLPHALAAFARVECFDKTRNGGRPVRVLTFQEGRLVGRAPQLPGWATGLVAAEP